MTRVCRWSGREWGHTRPRVSCSAPSPSTFLRLLRLPDQKLAQLRLVAQIFAMLPDEQSTPEQIAIYRQMTPERRLSLAEQLYWTAREIKAAWLRAQHTD